MSQSNSTNRVNRRQILVGAGALTTLAVTGINPHEPVLHEKILSSPTHAIIPIVGDGKWIWRKPPEKQTGYLEPRTFDLSIEIHAQGQKGQATNFQAFTPTPVAFGEQEILDFRMEKEGCLADVQKLSDSSARLIVGASTIDPGQTISAKAIYRLKLSKSYFGYEKDQFPAKQKIPRLATKLFTGNSPGIQTHSPEVKEVLKSVAANLAHPWEKAKKFHEWVFENIKGKPQAYTSVIQALRKKVGDCEERAGVFVALCRASGIPARLVWVPNHAWAEILLFDEKEKPHWVPVHTAAYSWFGWTGAHEVVIQKGDRIKIPEQKKHVRLIYDHYKCTGKRPKVFFTANLIPVADDNNKEPGPGARQKQKTGQWKLMGDDVDQKYMRP